MIRCACCPEIVAIDGMMIETIVVRQFGNDELWYCGEACAKLDDYARAKYGRPYKEIKEGLD